MSRYIDFLRNENHGSVTIWSLLWFTGFCAIMGIAIDTTAAMHTEAKLQHTSDSSSHAGVIDIFPDTDDAIATAVAYSTYNMSTSDVVNVPDVTPGHWDPDTRTFTSDPNEITAYNAVKVHAARETGRDNALLTTFLRVVGFYNWDIATESIAHYTDDSSLINRCRMNGLLAGGLMEQTANNTLSRFICVHGESEFKMTSNNVVTCGVELSTGGDYKTGQPPTYKEELGECNANYPILSNYEMMDQSFMYRSMPSNAVWEYDIFGKFLARYVEEPDKPLNDPLNLFPSYLKRGSAWVREVSVNTFNNLARVTGNSAYSGLVPGTLYAVKCTGGNKQIQLEGIVRNVGIYTNCEMTVNRNKKVSAYKPIKGKTGTHALVSCDPLISNDCTGDDWKLLLEPMLSCAQNLATVITTEPTSVLYNKYPEPYQTLDDTMGGPYRDDTYDPDGNHVCGMEPGATAILENFLFYSTANSGLTDEYFGPSLGSNRNQTTITFPNNAQLGRIDGCTQGGSFRAYLGGSVSTPSSIVMHGTQWVILGDAHMAAKANGVHGITVDAAGSIKYAAQGEMGGCSGYEGDGESDVVIAVRPIAIVD